MRSGIIFEDGGAILFFETEDGVGGFLGSVV